MVGLLQFEDFEQLRGSRFVVLAGEQEIPLTLDAVEASGYPAGGDRPVAFSLIFRPETGGPLLPQQIWTLRHEALGTIEIFLVPIQPDAKGTRYEAVFS